MKRRARSGMVLALWVLSLVLAAVAVSLDAVGPSPKSPLGEVVALVVEVLAFTTAGALVASRRPESPIGWLLLAEGRPLAGSPQLGIDLRRQGFHARAAD